MGNDNIGKFIKRVKKALMDKYELKHSNILIEQVEYKYNRNDKMDFLSAKDFHPKELFYKGKEFEHQREARIVVNSKNSEQKYLDISIGSMKGYSHSRKFVTQDDIELVLDVEVKEEKVIEERDGGLNRSYGNM